MRIWVSLLLVLSSTTLFAGDLEEAKLAWDRGNYQLAAEKYRAAAESGNPDAAAALGQFYEWGWGVEEDYGEALRWYQTAADHGLVRAQTHLGQMLEKGLGVPQNYTEAHRMYRRAAEQGDMKAQQLLGLQYSNGKGVPQNYVLAHMWFNLAAAQGDEWARHLLQTIADDMSREQVAKAQDLASKCIDRDYKSCE